MIQKQTITIGGKKIPLLFTVGALTRFHRATGKDPLTLFVSFMTDDGTNMRPEKMIEYLEVTAELAAAGAAVCGEEHTAQQIADLMTMQDAARIIEIYNTQTNAVADPDEDAGNAPARQAKKNR